MSKTLTQFRPHPVLSSEFSALQIHIPLSNPHAVIVSLYNPTKRNAINATMWREIGRLFSTIGLLGDGCRVVIIKGASEGHGFTSGIDLSDSNFFPSVTNQKDPARQGIAFGSQIQDMQRCFTAIEKECPIPVIAAIDGSCIGAGIDLASVCDIRICSSTTKFSVREVQIGLAADVGTIQRFPKITGNDSRIRELCLTGDFFGAEEALRIGFVSRITDRLMEDVIDLSKKIASNSPLAVIGTKRSLVYSRDHTVADGLRDIATYNQLALLTTDISTAAKSAKKKKLPEFENMPKFSKL